MTDRPTYEIRRLSDFTKVPPDRRAACLSEFLVALSYADDALESATAKTTGFKRFLLRKCDAAIFMSRFTWIDDTKRRATIIIQDRITESDTGTYHTENYTVIDPRKAQ